MSTAIASVTSTVAGSSTVGAPGQKALGKDDFLKLLLTQLQNQDPLSPVDNSQMLAQLAQFSSVEQMQSVASGLDSLLLAQASANQMNTASLVGRSVTFRTGTVDWTPGGQPAALQAQLADAADLVAVVQDASGRTVRTLQLGHQEAGSVSFTWDGADDRGNQVPAGSYQVVLGAKNAAGEDVGVEMRAHGVVRGVTFEGDAPLLLVGGSRVKLSDVVEITQA